MVSKKVSGKKSSVSKVLGKIKTPKKIKTAKIVKSKTAKIVKSKTAKIVKSKTKSKSGKKKGRIFGDPVVILE